MEKLNLENILQELENYEKRTKFTENDINEIKDLYLDVINLKREILELINEYCFDEFEDCEEEFRFPEYVEIFKDSNYSTFCIEDYIDTELVLYSEKSRKFFAEDAIKEFYDEELNSQILYYLNEYVIINSNLKGDVYSVSKTIFKIKLLEEKKYFSIFKTRIIDKIIELELLYLKDELSCR